eukprot:299680-Chlamydomonas_euryale.AAC.1
MARHQAQLPPTDRWLVVQKAGGRRPLSGAATAAHAAGASAPPPQRVGMWGPASLRMGVPPPPGPQIGPDCDPWDDVQAPRQAVATAAGANADGGDDGDDWEAAVEAQAERKLQACLRRPGGPELEDLNMWSALEGQGDEVDAAGKPSEQRGEAPGGSGKQAAPNEQGNQVDDAAGKQASPVEHGDEGNRPVKMGVLSREDDISGAAHGSAEAPNGVSRHADDAP